MYQEYRPSRFQILPPVVKNLLIVNGIMYLATVVLQEKFGYDLSQYLGLHFPTSQYFYPHQFLTHLFMHGSFLHIFSNMLGLWMFGNMLENLWGGKRFLIYYIICGLGAAAIHTLFTWYEIEQVRHAIENYAAVANPVDFKLFLTRYKNLIGSEQYDHINNLYASWQQSPKDPALIKESVNIAYEVLKNKTDVTTVGASGAVFGILLAFGMLFPNTIIYVYFAIPMKAKYFVMLYGLFELYSGFQNNPADNVAHFAHLGGMLFGFIMIKWWNKKNRAHFY